jgi:hypothetical protein
MNFCIIIIILFIFLATIDITFTKEKITLSRYKDIYLNSVNSITNSLTSNSVSLCNNINTDTNALQTNITNLLNSISSTLSSITTSQNNFTIIKNTITNTDIVNMDTKITPLTNNQTTLDFKFYTYTFRVFDATVNNDVDPSLSNLNTFLYSDYTNLISLSNTTNTSYTNAVATYNTLNTDRNSATTIKTNISDTLLPTLISYQTSLNNNLTLINNKINISTQIATDAYNYINVNDISTIQSVLGSIYTTAQTNLTSATSAKNTADNAVANDTTNNQQLLINQQIALVNYQEAYEMVRFLQNHAYVVTDLPNVDEIITINKNLSKAQAIYNFLSYFITNNLTQASSYPTLAVNTNSKIGLLNSTLTNINSKFVNTDSNVKTKLLKLVSDALTLCQNSKSQLNTLKTTVTTNLSTLSTNIANIQTSLNDMNTFLTNTNTQITNYRTKIDSANASISAVNKYKVEYYYYPNSYSTWDSNYTTTPIQIGTIQNTGKLQKIYIFANIYSWYTCVADSTYFNILLYNTSNTIVWNKNFYIYPTANNYMSIDYYNTLPSIPVTTGYTIRIQIIGSSSYTCKIISTNVQSSVEIDIS